MEVTISIDNPFSTVTISCDNPSILEITNPENKTIVVSLFRDGHDGKSAYQEWLDLGNNGSPEQFIESLRGINGETPVKGVDYFDGDDGMSAYQIWLNLGNTGSPEDFINSLRGQDAINNTLEDVRAANNTIEGNINADGHTIENLRNAIANQEPITKGQSDANLAEAKAYADTVSANTVRWAGFWDASTGNYPTATGIRRGDEYEINVAGSIAGIDFEVGDLIRARINTPAQLSANWSASQGNVQQSTETRQGTAKIVTAVNAADENSVNDTDILTAKKWWQNSWSRVKALAWTWAAKQTFILGIRLSNVGSSQYLKTDANKDVIAVNSIPATDVSQDTNNRMINDAQLTKVSNIDQSVSSIEKSTWNGKQDAIGYVTQEDLYTFNSSKGVFLYDEYLGNNSFTVPYSASVSGGGSNQIVFRTGGYGVLVHNTGSSATGQAGLTVGDTNAGSYVFGNGQIIFERRIYIPILSTATDEFTIREGFFATSNFLNHVGLFFLYDRTGIYPTGGTGAPGSVNWRCVSQKSGVVFGNSGVPVVAGQWIKLKIIVNAAGTQAGFYIDNVLVHTASGASFPATDQLYIRHTILKSVGTTARTYEADYFAFKHVFTSTR